VTWDDGIGEVSVYLVRESMEVRCTGHSLTRSFARKEDFTLNSELCRFAYILMLNEWGNCILYFELVRLQSKRVS
jgi:hypothetical protein